MKSLAILDDFPALSRWTEKFVTKLDRKDYRHAYMAEGVRTWIARQVRALREQREMSQADLGREADKPQSAISRIEDPDYGKLTLQTLFDLAAAFDLPLLVQFVDWEDWLSRMNDVSSAALEKASYDREDLLSPQGQVTIGGQSLGGITIGNMGANDIITTLKVDMSLANAGNWLTHVGTLAHDQTWNTKSSLLTLGAIINVSDGVVGHG
jgi:transcriptional regulator with XRE-family HTH domain